MDFEELEEWITQQRNKGISDSEIRNQLQAQGFSEQDINQAFQELVRNSNYNKENKKQTVNKINNKNSRENYGSSDRNSFSDNNRSKAEEDTIEDIKVDDVIHEGLNFFRSDVAKKTFAYIFIPLFILSLISASANLLDGSGSLESLALPLFVGVFFSLIFAVIGYMKAFRTILSYSGVDIRPIGGLGSLVLLLRLGIGYLLYLLIILALTLLFILPGVYAGIRLYFFNFSVMQGQGIISSFKTSWEITRGKALKTFTWHITAGVLGTLLGLIFRLPAEILARVGYPNLSLLVTTPGTVVSIIATTAALSAVYSTLINQKGMN